MPSTFQRGMELVLRGLQWDILLIYLDDVIFTSNTFQEHLGEVLSRFRQFGSKLKPTRCILFKNKVLFLDHGVGKDGLYVNPSLIQDVEKWPVTQNLKELQAFLVLTNYYRRVCEGICC